MLYRHNYSSFYFNPSMTNRTGRVVIIVSTILPWIAIVTALGAWGTESADVVIMLMTGLTFLIAGIGLWIGEHLSS